MSPKPSSRRFDPNQLAELKATADFVALASEFQELKQSGTSWITLCPFHDDHNPSLHITPTKQLFNCPSCNTGGDVFKFIQKVANLDFVNAVYWIAERTNFDIEPITSGTPIDHQALRKLLHRAHRFFQSSLQTAPATKRQQIASYLQDHGISSAQAENYGIGYAPDALNHLTNAALATYVTPEDLNAAGLTTKGRGGEAIDYFRDRLIFPIFNTLGELTGFGGRALNSSAAKYLNTPSRPLFNKSQLLYGGLPDHPLPTGVEQIFVVEGYTDALAINSNSDFFALSPMSTALTQAHAKQLAGMTSTVHLIFDGDSSGITSAIRASAVLLSQRGLDIRMFALPAGQDPASKIATDRPGFLTDALNHSEIPFVFAIRETINLANLTTARGRDQLVDQLVPLFSAAPAGPLRHEQLELAAAAARIPTDELRQALLERSNQRP